MENKDMPEQARKISIDEIFEATAAGVLRGMKALGDLDRASRR